MNKYYETVLGIRLNDQWLKVIVLEKVEIVRKHETVERPRDCAMCCGVGKTCTVKVPSENRYFKRKSTSTTVIMKKNKNFVINTKQLNCYFIVFPIFVIISST